MKLLLTIDPGANGGICLRTATGEIRCCKMPGSLSGLADALRDAAKHEGLRAIMEDVGFHREGSHAQGSATLARQVGQIEMALAMLRIPVQYVRPQTWMTAFPDRPKSLTKLDKTELKMQYPSASAKQFAKIIEKSNAERKKNRKAYIKAKVQEALPYMRVYPNSAKAKYTHKVTDWCADALGILLWANRELPP